MLLLHNSHNRWAWQQLSFLCHVTLHSNLSRNALHVETGTWLQAWRYCCATLVWPAGIAEPGINDVPTKLKSKSISLWVFNAFVINFFKSPQCQGSIFIFLSALSARQVTIMAYLPGYNLVFPEKCRIIKRMQPSANVANIVLEAFWLNSLSILLSDIAV